MTTFFKRRPFTVRQLRLATGLTLFAYIATHLLNHSLGVVSLAAMESGLLINQSIWTGKLGTAALFGALLTHLSLGIWALYERRWHRLRAAELIRLALGLSIPLLLFGHIVGTRIAFEAYDRALTYERMLLFFWQTAPWLGVKQSALLLAAWTHGCMGVYFWLRLKPNFPRVSAYLLTAAVLLPTLALIGFANGGREVARLAADPAEAAAMAQRFGAVTQDALANLELTANLANLAFLALVAGAFCARGLRTLRERGAQSARVTYPDGRAVRLPRGMSVLDGSRMIGAPHVSICGGRGRCSTCRVRVVRGLTAQPPASDAERAVLTKIDADPTTRLACQLRPVGDLTVVPLLQPQAAESGRVRPATRSGREQAVAILFTDIRGSTPIVEKRLPYDIVFLLNRFFETIGGAIVEVGGFPNQFIGDSVMALFGAESDIRTACRQALEAAQNMADKLDRMNLLMADDLPQPIRIGIGVHAGSAVVGEMGYAASFTTTAVGDPVHVAARLQELTKTYACQLVVSEYVAETAGVDLSRFRREEIQVRGRQQPLGIYIIPKASDLDLELATRG